MFNDVSNTIQNFMFMTAAIFEIAGGGGGGDPPWYQVWVPKSLAQEGLSVLISIYFSQACFHKRAAMAVKLN